MDLSARDQFAACFRDNDRGSLFPSYVVNDSIDRYKMPIRIDLSWSRIFSVRPQHPRSLKRYGARDRAYGI